MVCSISRICHGVCFVPSEFLPCFDLSWITCGSRFQESFCLFFVNFGHVSQIGFGGLIVFAVPRVCVFFFRLRQVFSAIDVTLYGHVSRSVGMIFYIFVDFRCFLHSVDGSSTEISFLVLVVCLGYISF